jgi:hypothetical protein
MVIQLLKKYLVTQHEGLSPSLSEPTIGAYPELVTYTSSKDKHYAHLKHMNLRDGCNTWSTAVIAMHSVLVWQ